MADMILKAILLAVLVFCGVQDIRRKKITIGAVLIGLIVGVICLPFCQSLSAFDRIGGAVIGVGIAAVSLITAGKIGMGDAFLLCLTGLGLGLWGNLEMLAIALFFAAVFSIILLVLRLADRKRSIPFVPFLLIGYVIVIIAER